jgi:hypothetical protein
MTSSSNWLVSASVTSLNYPLTIPEICLLSQRPVGRASHRVCKALMELDSGIQPAVSPHHKTTWD